MGVAGRYTVLPAVASRHLSRRFRLRAYYHLSQALSDSSLEDRFPKGLALRHADHFERPRRS